MFQSLLDEIKTLSILVLISLILMILENIGLLNTPKALLQQVTLPVQYGLYKTSTGVSRQFEFIFLARTAAQENKALKDQLAQILSENSNLRKQLAETQGLLDQQKTLNPQNFTLLPARPVGMSRYLYIDKGSDDGVKINQVVVYQDNLLGLVKEVTPKRSAVMLSTDPDSHLSAFTQNSQGGRARGVLSGQFGSEMLLDKVLHQEPLQPGDLVYSEGSELEVPRGLIIGQVSQVHDQDNQIFKTAVIKANFEPSDLDIVFLITN